MSDYQFPETYSSERPDYAARQIAACWIEAVLRGNARDLYTTVGWSDEYRNKVRDELRKLQAELVNPEGWRFVD